jgi:hypothetical protein
VREHAEAAVLRLDRVVADPDAGRVVRIREETAVVRERVPVGSGVEADVPAGADGEAGGGAVRPDRVRALVRIACGLVAAGVDDLEVVDERVRLAEVPVTVDVEPIPWSYVFR